MILQALKEYYDRKAADPESGIAPSGWFQGRIDFVIALNPDGKFGQLECLQVINKGKRQSHSCLLPYIGKQALKHTMSGKDANLLWDNASFVLGLGKNGKTKLESFISTIKERLGDADDPAVKAVLTYLEAGQCEPACFQPVVQHPEYGEEIREGRASLTFRLTGDSNLFVFERPQIRAMVSEGVERTERIGTCLVTGETNQAIEICHVVVKNLYGAQKDPNLVSFNRAAFNSFGKDQSANAPVGKCAAFAYNTALNYLASRGSKQKLQVGDATVVFWSAKDTDLEKQIVEFFSESPKDDPDRGSRAIASLFKAVETGAFVDDKGTIKFFVLGMTPFGPRIAIRFWIVDTVSGMAGKIRQHFEDIRVIHGPKDRDEVSIFSLLVSTATQRNAENIPPNVAGETMRAILSGLPYPQTLLQAVIRRIRAEQSRKNKLTGKPLPNVTHERAALVKACINRATRFINNKEKEELKVSLDETNTNIGYRLGRLFAALEKIQQEASPGINATIRDRFYSAASSTPVTVFGNLMRLKNHHLAKLDNVGRKVTFEKLLTQIVSDIRDYPTHLKLEDQGRFHIGYYHQMQDFFTKKSK